MCLLALLMIDEKTLDTSTKSDYTWSSTKSDLEMMLRSGLFV